MRTARQAQRGIRSGRPGKSLPSLKLFKIWQVLNNYCQQFAKILRAFLGCIEVHFCKPTYSFCGIVQSLEDLLTSAPLQTELEPRETRETMDRPPKKANRNGEAGSAPFQNIFDLFQCFFFLIDSSSFSFHNFKIQSNVNIY